MTVIGRVAIVLVLLGVLLGLWVRSGVPAVDQSALEFVLDHRTAGRSTLARVVTECGGTLAVTVVNLLVVVFALCRRWWLLAARAVLAGLGTALLIVGGKAAFGRPRPPADTQLGILQNLSFPSGHALGSVVAGGLVLAVVFALTPTRWSRVAAVLIVALYVLAVGLSRLYLGVHWSTDVLGGWLLGAGWVLLCVDVGQLSPRWLPRRP